jgi:filamentous hemagglutinin family protein
MNANRYRLVFDETRGMLVPVCENMPSHGKRVGGEAAAICLTVLLGFFGTFAAGDVFAQTTQRVIPAALAAIARPAAGYVPPTSAFTGNGYGSYNATGSYGEVTQTALRAIFNWSNLNIGKGGHVHFKQPTGGSAVNRIGSADPTVIEGMLTATGQLYLINQNGVLFGGGAQVNVGGMVASTLNISDEVFQKGWLSQQGKQAAFAFEGTAGQFQSSFVRVEAGAQLASGEGGGIYMFAPRVENAGKIETPGGQAMLAAGSKVYLAAPTNARMRGFLVEVDPFVGKDADGKDVNIGGSVAVDKVGEIIARRGNITLAGLAVNHAGRMTATTTVDANGSIFIKARDTAAEIKVDLPDTSKGGDYTVEVKMTESTRGGDATLEAGSVIEIVNEKAESERLIADSRTLLRSLVDISGKHIVLEGSSGGSAGARIAAKSGEVNLVTAYNGLLPDINKTVEADQRIFLGAGSSIDASGLKKVAAPITRNIVEVELRGDELKDSPLLRDKLSGTKVRVDVRKGTKIADVSGYEGKIERTIDEKSTVGGTVVLRSDGDVVIRENASIDVSGGSIDYSKGNTASSYLTWAGGSDAIEAARTDRIYTGAYDVVREEVGYSEGKNAGSIGIFGKRLALAGDLKGGVTPGINQRGAGMVPRAATLELNNKTLLSYDSTTGAPLWRYDGLAQTVRFINGTADLSSTSAASALPDDFRLDL